MELSKQDIKNVILALRKQVERMRNEVDFIVLEMEKLAKEMPTSWQRNKLSDLTNELRMIIKGER